MAIVELRDKSYDRDVRTDAHNFHFCKSDPPKQINIFVKGSVPGYKDRLVKAEDGTEANYNLYMALRSFMRNSDIKVELTKEEESFMKKVVPEVYTEWLKNNPKVKEEKDKKKK